MTSSNKGTFTVLIHKKALKEIDALAGEAMVWEPVDQQVIPQSMQVSQSPSDEDSTEPWFE